MVAGKEIGPRVKELEPNRRMLRWDGLGEFTREWILDPLDMKAMRLLGSGRPPQGRGSSPTAPGRRRAGPATATLTPNATRAQFAAFDEPGYVKIVYTLAADPLGPNRSSFVTRTRVVTTDPESRRRFRRYWAPMSTGIILIRYLSLPMVKREAERRARHPAGGQPPTDLAGEESTTGTSPARP